MAAPSRHGQRWFRGPTPTPQGGDPVAIRGPAATPTGPAPAPTRVIPVKEMNAWYRRLPSPNVLHKLITGEVRYKHSLSVGQKLQLSSTVVTENYVWVFTDIDFYAMAPATAMLRPPLQLDPESLVGILRLELTFGGTTPITTSAQRLSPYTTPAQYTATVPTTSGWPWLQTPFGSQRMPSFALYAKGNEEIRVEATIEALPRFPISRLGVNMHGFSVPTTLFPSAWS